MLGVPPEEVLWRVAEDGDLLEAAGVEPPPEPPPGVGALTVPAAFLSLAADVVLHRSEPRFDLLYRLLWRLGGKPGLLALTTDGDVAQARSFAHQVSKASHKMKAFVRFRLAPDNAETAQPAESYVAWFEPPHRVVERTAPFFIDRFANQRFSILTPDRCLHWDLREARFTPGVQRPEGGEDALEDYWLTYYASIFNPARLKVRAMQSEMPKRYWRNLPEAALIPSLVAEAEERSRLMVEQEPTTPARRIPPRPVAETPPNADDAASLAGISTAIQQCRRCDLWRNATQGVPGQGPRTARLLMVGEQPGDAEDLAGKPFVGPAGQLLDRALAAAGVIRADVYVTNAVKHFKHEVRGKRRLHKTPDAGEVQACQWWLTQERALVKPRLTVALGSTAAMAVFGRPMPVTKSRGRFLPLEDGGEGLITYHPSFLLRVPDRAAKEAAWKDFVSDLSLARERIAA